MLSNSTKSLPTEINGTPAWHAAYTKHQHEKTVARILTFKGFETFLPLCQESRRWQDRVKMVSLPLFPCYVFFKGGLGRRLDIATTPGLHGLVLSAGQPASIPAGEIEAIQRGIESGARLEPHFFLKSGEWVRVKSGALQGIQGILLRTKNVDRLVLTVEMLGKSAAVEVDAAIVERVRGGPPYECGSLYAATFPTPQRRIA